MNFLAFIIVVAGYGLMMFSMFKEMDISQRKPLLILSLILMAAGIALWLFFSSKTP